MLNLDWNALKGLIELVVGVIIATPIIIQGIRYVGRELQKTSLTWGEFDHPLPTRADFYIYYKSRKQNEIITLQLHPGCMQPTDYKVKICQWRQCIGYDEVHTIPAKEENLDRRKEVEFTLPDSGCYRLIVESGGGHVGTTLLENLRKLIITLPDARIKYKPHKNPNKIRRRFRMPW